MFEPQAAVQREFWADSPIFLSEQAELVLLQSRVDLAGGERELARAAAELADCLGRKAERAKQLRAAVCFDTGDRYKDRRSAGHNDLVCAVQRRRHPAVECIRSSKILCRAVVETDILELHPSFNKMLIRLERKVVLQLPSFLVVECKSDLSAPSCECAGHTDRGHGVVAHLRCLIANELEPGFVNGFGIQHRGLGKLHSLRLPGQIESA